MQVLFHLFYCGKIRLKYNVLLLSQIMINFTRKYFNNNYSETKRNVGYMIFTILFLQFYCGKDLMNFYYLKPLFYFTRKYFIMLRQKEMLDAL